MSGDPAWPCPVCGGREFRQTPVLWPELIDAWELTQDEVLLIDRQQGFCCASCGSNLRSMTIAAALLREFGSPMPLREFVARDPVVHQVRILEFNDAGNLTPYLSRCRQHMLVHYPEVDMQATAFPDEAFDIIVHSDTLEHVADPVMALKECRRLLSPQGKVLLTIPIVPTRLTRRRAGMGASYHGLPGQNTPDHLVHTEYGADFFRDMVEAGFLHITLHTLGDLASFCIVGHKR